MGTSNKGKLCKNCKKGRYGENSIYDNMYGTLSCPKCSHSVPQDELTKEEQALVDAKKQERILVEALEDCLTELDLVTIKVRAAIALGRTEK